MMEAPPSSRPPPFLFFCPQGLPSGSPNSSPREVLALLSFYFLNSKAQGGENGGAGDRLTSTGPASFPCTSLF